MILTGKEVADAITERISIKCENLKGIGVKPTLAIVRIGENPSDLAYERGAVNRASKVGIDIKKIELGENVSTEDVVKEIEKLNKNEEVNGILVFRPLPSHIDDDIVRNAVSEEKDVDGIGDKAMAGIYSDNNIGYPPCTAKACMEILKHYNIGIEGKNIVVIGRSLVIGKPISMMLLKENATVTICHSRTKNIEDITKKADIVIAAVGKAKFVTKDFINEKQVIIDVGINVDDEGNMCGDVDFDNVAENVFAITPVPRGVGAVTTSVLMSHVIESAEKSGK